MTANFQAAKLLRLIKIFGLFGSLLASSAFPQAQLPDSLSMEQAIHFVLASHPAMQQAEHFVIASEARLRRSMSASYPDLSGEASYSRVGPIPTFDLPGGESFALLPANNYDAHATLRHTFYDFGKRAAAIDFARSSQVAATDNIELIKASLAYQTIDVFYAILFLQQNVTVLDDQIAALEQHLQVSRKKSATGTATDFDVLTTQVRVAAAKSQKVDIENALPKQEINLRQLLGVPADSPIRLYGDFAATQIMLQPDSLIQLAMRQRSEMQLARDAEETANLRIKLVRLNDKPSLSLRGVAGFKNGYIPNLNMIKANWLAGLQVQVPIFNGFRTRNQLAESNANLGVSLDRTRQIERAITAEVSTAIAEVQASLEKIDSSTLQVQQAEEALALSRNRYEIGVATNLDLLDAETALSQARLLHLKALYDDVSSRYELTRAVGDRVW